MHVCTVAHVFAALYACRFVCPNLLIFLPFLLCFPVSRSVRYNGDQFSDVDISKILLGESSQFRSVFLFLHQPPPTSAPLFCFSVLCLRVMERVLLKMLRSNLILYISQGRSRSFLYISTKDLYTPWGSTVCIHCLFLCPVVAAFVPVCQFFFKLLSRVFLVHKDLWNQTGGMGSK